MAYIKLYTEYENRNIIASKEEWIFFHCGEDLSDEPAFPQTKIKKNWWNKTEAKSNQKVLA